MRAKFSLFGAPQWDISNVWQLSDDHFLVGQEFWGIGRGASYCGRFVLISSKDGEIGAQYLFSVHDGKWIGETGSLLWFDTYNDGLHARKLNSLALAIPKDKVGIGMPPGGWLKYQFDRQLMLLGVDGRYYAIDNSGRASVIAAQMKDGKERRESDEANATVASTKKNEITLEASGDGKYILHANDYSKTYFDAEFLRVHSGNSDFTFIIYSDLLGPTGKPRIGRIAADGSELWNEPLSTLIDKPRIPDGILKVKSAFKSGSDTILFLQEDDRKKNYLHAGHMVRVDSDMGRLVLSRPLKDY
jgi:hypothetical protein